MSGPPQAIVNARGWAASRGIIPWYAAGVLSRAVAAWRADRYDPALDALVDVTGRGHHARLGSTLGPDSNDPTRLPFEGEKSLFLPGVDANYASTPHSLAYFPDEITWEFDADAAAWNRGVNQALVDKGLRWRVWITVNGEFRFQRRLGDGTSPSVAIGTLVGSGRRHLRVEYSIVTGKVQAFQEVGGTWIPLSAQVAAAAEAWTTDSSPIQVGVRSDSGGTYPFLGRFNRAIIHSGLHSAGNLVPLADFDPRRSVEPHTSFVAATGETWTITRSATGHKAVLVDRPLLLFGTDDYLEVANASELNFDSADDLTIVVVLRHYGDWGVGGGGAVLTKRAGNGIGLPGYALRGGGSSNRSIGGQLSTFLAGFSPGPAGAYQVALRRQAGTAAVFIAGVEQSGAAADAASLSNSYPVRIGAYGVAAAFADMEFFAAAIFREALTADDLSRLAREFGVTL